jgi:hypothetical protein
MHSPGTEEQDHESGVGVGGLITPYFDDELRQMFFEAHSRADVLLPGRTLAPLAI